MTIADTDRTIIFQHICKQLEGMAAKRLIESVDVYRFTIWIDYRVEYLGLDPDNGWTRESGERFSKVIEEMERLGCQYEPCTQAIVDSFFGLEKVMFHMPRQLLN